MLGVSLTRAQAPAWWPANAIYAADFVNRRYMRAGAPIAETSAISFSRSSSAWAQNAAGQWVEFGANQPRFTPGGLLLEPQRENLVRNNAMAGAIAGTPGTLPTHWARFRTGTLNEPAVVGTGRRDGVDYIDLRLSGTASGNNDLGVFVELLLPMAASSGYCLSGFFELISGSLSAASFAHMSCGRYLDGAYVSGSPTIDLKVVGAWQRYSFSDTVPGAGVNQIRPSIAMRLGSGLSIDAVIRIGWPQLELGPSISSPVISSGTTFVRATDSATLYLVGGPQQLILRYDDGNEVQLSGPYTGSVQVPLGSSALRVASAFAVPAV